MQYMFLAELAAVVSNAGGLGIVPAMAFQTTDNLHQEMDKMRALTTKPFGFNISFVPEVVIPELIFDYIQVLIEEGVQIVETSGQRPAEFIRPLKEAGIKVIHKVTTVRHAKAAEADGADIISVIGMEGGGHPGSSHVAGQILWAKAAEKLSVPVLAGGGIVDGKGIYAALALGVDGVLMSTRFAVTPEVNASDAYREAVLSVPEYGTVLTMTSLNNAMRVANNTRAQEILKAEAEGATIKELMPLISGKSNFEAMMGGRLDEAQLSVGQGIGRIDKIQTVSEIFEEIKQDFLHVHQSMNVLLS